MEFMAKAFKESKITGPVLMALTEKHMKEMGCCVLGEQAWFTLGKTIAFSHSYVTFLLEVVLSSY